MPSTNSQQHPEDPGNLWKLAAWLFSSDAITALTQIWRLARKMLRSQTQEGMYELLDYEHHLELCDTKGKTAVSHKRQRVRFLQNNIIAYQDMAWGDGEIFASYRCSPGVEVDRYDEGHRWWILISLREFKNRGDIEEFAIDRTMHDSFIRNREHFQTEIIWRTQKFTTSVIFPKGRHPKQVKLIEQNSNRTSTLGPDQLITLPDGRLQAMWRTDKPKLFEAYILQWVW